MRDPKKKLNARQSQFIKEYLIDYNALGAAIRAGYSQKTAYSIGHNLLKKIEITKAIQEVQKAREKRTEITADYVLTSLKSVAERCQQIEPVLDKEGKPTGEYRFEHAGANKALELLGKNLKLFTDRLEVREIKSLDDLSESEIASLREDLRKRIEG